jgi:hypothetical protein
LSSARASADMLHPAREHWLLAMMEMEIHGLDGISKKLFDLLYP